VPVPLITNRRLNFARCCMVQTVQIHNTHPHGQIHHTLKESSILSDRGDVIHPGDLTKTGC
jgi:hypothetical protein